MALALPAPKVPDLHPDNYIDLDQLGGSALETLVDYPGIAAGDEFWPNWRGCSKDGEVVDFFLTLIPVEPDELTPEGMPVQIDNGLLVNLDQGWVFYSYQMFDPSSPDQRGEESLRRFFYVGKRERQGAALPVPHCKESHDLCLDVSQLPADVTVVVLPYQAMSVGDKVTLTVDKFFEDGTEYPITWKRTQTLTAADIGHPLQWSVEEGDFQAIDKGQAHLSYSIAYAVPTLPTVSPLQTLHMVPPQAPLLPALTIKDHTGDSLDPDDFPNGLTLQITQYAGLQSGDGIVLYATSGTHKLRKALRADRSNVDSEVLEFTLDKDWLQANNGEALELSYQYARLGAAGTSQPFTVMLRKPLSLPVPVVDGAQAEEGDDQYPHKGYIFAAAVASDPGVYIEIPEDAEIGTGNEVKMHWEGFTPTGSHIADHIVGNERRFQIPLSAVPANFNKRVKVFYTVTVPGESPEPSEVFSLEVRPGELRWPTIQVDQNPIYLSRVPVEGALLTLDNWVYIAQGQRVNIIAKALNKQTGREHSIDLRSGADEAVTEDEYSEGKLRARLPKDFLENSTLDDQVTVSVTVSFDEGENYLTFPGTYPYLRP
jgi:hypothetical protein